MKRTFALGVLGAAVAAATLFAAPPSAKAQVGISVGFGSGFGSGFDYYDDDYSPGWLGVGYSAPVSYYGGYAPSYYAPAYYDARPAYRVVRRAPVRVVVREPTYYYAPRQVVRTRVVTRAPRYVTRVVTQAPEIRRTRVIRQTYY